MNLEAFVTDALEAVEFKLSEFFVPKIVQYSHTNGVSL